LLPFTPNHVSACIIYKSIISHSLLKYTSYQSGETEIFRNIHNISDPTTLNMWETTVKVHENDGEIGQNCY